MIIINIIIKSKVMEEDSSPGNNNSQLHLFARCHFILFGLIDGEKKINTESIMSIALIYQPS